MTIINALPFTLQNGTTADATQVMADFDEIVSDVNSNAAHNGVNTDITALTGLTTPLTPAQGGTSSYIGGTSGGAANVQTLANPSPNGFSLAAGNRVTFIAGFTNTGAATLNVNTLGATNVFRQTPAGPVALIGGEIALGNTVEVEFDGTQFVIFNDTAQVGGYGPRTSLASATTTDLGTIPSHNIQITGTTTITAFGSSAVTTYPFYQIQFGGILTLTYNATSLILPGSVSITTAVGDQCLAHYLGSGNWRVVAYWKQNGTPVNFNASFLQGYINGLTLSTAGSSATLSIAAGIAADSTNASMMALNSGLNKTTSSWGVGNAGGLDTGAIAINTWYHFYEIQRVDTGVVDAVFSLSASAPTLPTNYTLYRRIGSAKTDGSSQWTKFTQTGDEFIWSAMVADSGVAGTASRNNLTLTVPTGVVVKALARATISPGSTEIAMITSLQESDQSTTSSRADVSTQVSGLTGPGNIERWTNTSAQVGIRCSNSLTVTCNTYGWIDPRGKS